MERLKTFTDKRGSLTLLEVGQDIPFPVERVFWIHNVPEGQERGQHANTELSEYLVAVSGSFDIWTEDITGRKHYHLSSPSEGLLIPPGMWKVMSNFSPDAVVLVLASHPYCLDNYINAYDEFLEFIVIWHLIS